MIERDEIGDVSSGPKTREERSRERVFWYAA